VGDEWVKHLVKVCAPRHEVREALEALAGERSDDPVLSAGISRLNDQAALHPSTVARLEQTFWPARILAGSLPTYIVPIRAAYAAQLFDEGLASQDLFGAQEHLALSFRNVYYRSSKGLRVPSPARVLWYVSGDKHYAGSGAIRGLSHAGDTVRGSAKELFSRFRRLGIYEWRQILETAGDPSNQLEAFTFSHTELFQKTSDVSRCSGRTREDNRFSESARRARSGLG
jgi:hypothetical protein